MKQIFFPWSIKNPSDRWEKASHLCGKCGFSLAGWIKDRPEKRVIMEVKKIFVRLVKHPFQLIVCDDVSTIETLYELLPITHIGTLLTYADALTTHELVELFEEGDFDDDVTRHMGEITKNKMLVWIYPTTKYRRFFSYESRIYNIMTDRVVSKQPTVFLIHSDGNIHDTDFCKELYADIANAVGKNISMLIKTECNLIQIKRTRETTFADI